jgi:hypothetical protein
VVPIRFICQDGYHTGETFHLLCSAAKPCLAGRSKQARYKKNGLSLYRDLEMSTSHAQIGLDADTLQPYIMDTGYESTSSVFFCSFLLHGWVQHLLSLTRSFGALNSTTAVRATGPSSYRCLILTKRNVAERSD